MRSIRSKHSLRVARIVVVLALLVGPLGCATSPTGRTQFLLNSETQMAEMGRAAFADLESKKPLSTDPREVGYVRCVANAITSVLRPDELRPLGVTRWEVEVFEDPTANAFALPGGKIGVHTGLLDVARSPAQLAAVLGHEVGHVLARHSNERVSQTTVVQSGMAIAQVLVGADTPAKQQLFGALGLGLQYGVLMPFSRTQESEADEIGIELMARAGFDPRESALLWQNMSRASAGQAPPEFLSTHPSHATRIRRLQELVPKMMPIYERAIATGHRPNCG